MFACICLFQAEVGIRALTVTGVQTCALPIYPARAASLHARRRGGRGDAARPPGGGSRALKSARGVTERPPCANLRPNESRGARSEERRVGKECRSRGSPDH